MRPLKRAAERRSRASRILDPWWKAIAIWLLSISGTAAGIFFDFDPLVSTGLVMTGLSVAAMLVSAIRQWIKRRWLVGFVNATLGIGSIFGACLLLLAAITLRSFESKDHWADNLTIPPGLAISEPERYRDPAISADVSETPNQQRADLMLYNGFQPGIYSYKAVIPRTAAGSFYLKAYEITGNTRLSEASLARRTAIKVLDADTGFREYGMRADNFFKIYEGDWGKPYAARLELWYRPAAGGQEQKLLEKNYRIEGWMR